MFTFNLLDERWLPCVTDDGSLQSLSLREVLLNASKVSELVGDSPPVTIALYRLLLAILHRALSAPRTTGEWNEIREAGNFDREKLRNYFELWKSRFDLFDAVHPFYQSASARENVQSGAIIQLYFQGKNNATLFDHSTTAAPNAVSAAEAARFLVAFQAFDFGGIKADGSAQTAPLLQSAIALIKGENLFETLLLNLHRYDGEKNPFVFKLSKDLPAWEREEETQAVERMPDGYVDLLTWQARRISLQPELDENGNIIVKNTVIMRGYALPKTVNRHAKETMIAFRASKTEGFFPVGFSETRALWRNSLSLFQTVGGERSRAKTFDWLDDLVNAGFLDRVASLPVDFCGLAADKGKLLFWQQENFNLPLAYLNNDDLLNLLKTAIEFSEEISNSLRAGTKKLAKTLTGDEATATNFPALSLYWSSLETRFQQTLSDLPVKKDAAVKEWCRDVLSIADQAFDKTADTLSGSAQELKAVVEAKGFYFALCQKTKKSTSFQSYVPQLKAKGGNQ